jgi:hypothetical protein
MVVEKVDTALKINLYFNNIYLPTLEKKEYILVPRSKKILTQPGANRIYVSGSLLG